MNIFTKTTFSLIGIICFALGANAKPAAMQYFDGQWIGAAIFSDQSGNKIQEISFQLMISKNSLKTALVNVLLKKE